MIGYQVIDHHNVGISSSDWVTHKWTSEDISGMDNAAEVMRARRKRLDILRNRIGDRHNEGEPIAITVISVGFLVVNLDPVHIKHIGCHCFIPYLGKSVPLFGSCLRGLRNRNKSRRWFFAERSEAVWKQSL